MDIDMQYERITVEPCTEGLGAQVSGIDLRKPLDQQTIQEIQDAWRDYLVLFFKDQDVTPEELLAFAQNFGKPFVYDKQRLLGQTLKKEGCEDVNLVTSKVVNRIKHDDWHSDVSWRPEPPSASIVRAVEVPPIGGKLMFANMYLVYESLTTSMQHSLSELSAVHDSSYLLQRNPKEISGRFKRVGQMRGRFRRSLISKVLQKVEGTSEHPVVCTHPVTRRKYLFVSPSFTSHIKGLSAKESEELLRFLGERINHSEFHCQFRWKKHSIAMWDERCVQHHRVYDFDPTQPRLLHRVYLSGVKPFLDISHPASVGNQLAEV